MDLIQLSSLALFCFVATATPGPNNVMLMTSGLNFGVKPTLPHWLGVCVGFPIMALAVALGCSVLFERFPVVQQLIEVLGVSYLLYLAWRIATTKPQVNESTNRKPLTFIQALVFQWVNPKAWVMATSAIATFAIFKDKPYLNAVSVAVVFLLVEFPATGAWVFCGAWLRKLIQKPSFIAVFNMVMALLLVLSIAPVIYRWFN